MKPTYVIGNVAGKKPMLAALDLLLQPLAVISKWWLFISTHGRRETRTGHNCRQDDLRESSHFRTYYCTCILGYWSPTGRLT